MNSWCWTADENDSILGDPRGNIIIVIPNMAQINISGWENGATTASLVDLLFKREDLVNSIATLGLDSQGQELLDPNIILLDSIHCIYVSRLT